MDLKKRWQELSGAALIAFLLGCSMSLTLLDAFSISFSPWRAALSCALTSLACAALLGGRISALIAAIGVGTGAGIVAVKGVNIFAALKEALVALLTVLVGGEGSVNEHALTVLLVLTILLTLMAFLLTRLSGGVYPALLLYMFVMLGGWFMEKRLIPVYAAPGLIALAVLYARSQRETVGYLKVLPVAVLSALLAVLLIPAGNVTWKPLENAAEKVRSIFYDYFMFTDPRTVYSVSSNGYQPQGDTLGGPATPRDAEIMSVKTDRLLLLRGSVRRTYTGSSWVDNSINSRYLFIDPTRQTLRDAVFDADIAASMSDLFEEINVSIEMLGDGTSTLFVPHRLKSLSVPLDLAAYYNDSGEVFITRGVTYGDAYDLTAYALTADDEQLNRLIASVVPGSDADYEGIQNGYMNLPAGLDNDVYWLTQEVVKDTQTAYEKAAAIRDYLLSDEFTYRLDVEIPPTGRDFVSHFLLDSKEGYCTYYASAMAVMARLAGLPSRYVEGYIVPSASFGVSIVTGNNAHAWVEIYFEGIGWIPFDATPGEHGSGDPTENTPPSVTPTPTPTPTPSPSPSPTPDRGDAPPDDGQPDTSDATPTPSPTPETDFPNAPESTPTPEPSEPPSSPEDDQPPEENHSFRALLTLLLILLLLLIAAALLRWRWNATDPCHLAGRQPDDATRLMLWYRSILTLLTRTGFVPNGGETPEQFARRLVQTDAAPEELIVLAQAVERQQYARRAPDAEVFEMAQAAYEHLLARMKPVARLRWHLYRLTHGFGNFMQIP